MTTTKQHDTPCVAVPQEGQVEDHTVIHCQDIREVKAKLDEMNDVLTAMAVQEQRMATFGESVLSIRGEVCKIHDRFVKLQSDHDKCLIASVATDVSWIKWFVMANTVSILGLVLGFVAKLVNK